MRDFRKTFIIINLKNLEIMYCCGEGGGEGPGGFGEVLGVGEVGACGRNARGTKGARVLDEHAREPQRRDERREKQNRKNHYERE